LQNAVKEVSSLRQVRINAEHEVAEGRPRITYQHYIPLVLSAAEAYDEVINNMKNTSSRQQIQSNDTYLSNVTSQSPPLQLRRTRVNQSENTPRRNFIPKEAWMRIPEDVRKLLSSGQNNHRQDCSRQDVNNANIGMLNDEENIVVDTPSKIVYPTKICFYTRYVIDRNYLPD
jgi:hypothetical protein